jgi:hypothetical protein
MKSPAQKSSATEKRNVGIGEARRRADLKPITGINGTNGESPVFGYPGRHEMKVQIGPLPSQQIVPLPAKQAGQILVYELIPQGDSTFKAVARPRDRHVRITRRVLRSLGIGLSYATLRRLGQGGFIKVTHVAPGVYTLDLPSYFEHLRKVESDEEFWERTVEVPGTNGHLRRITNAQLYRESALLCKH